MSEGTPGSQLGLLAQKLAEFNARINELRARFTAANAAAIVDGKLGDGTSWIDLICDLYGEVSHALVGMVPGQCSATNCAYGVKSFSDGLIAQVGLWQPGDGASQQAHAQYQQRLQELRVRLLTVSAEATAAAWRAEARELDTDSLPAPVVAPDAQPVSDTRGADAPAAATAAGRTRGPKPDYETNARVAEIVARVAPDGDWRSKLKLEDVCEALDEEGIPVPGTWHPRGLHRWVDYPDRATARKAIEGRLENQRKKTTPN